MTRIGLYTATENELGSVQRAAERVDAEFVVRSESDFDDVSDVDQYCDELLGAERPGRGFVG